MRADMGTSKGASMGNTMGASMGASRGLTSRRGTSRVQSEGLIRIRFGGEQKRNFALRVGPEERQER